MKRYLRFTALLTAAVLLLCTGALTVWAKELEVCRLCGGKGDYHCAVCGNTGTVTCHGCNGTGTWECPGEDGRGKCDHGYYTCPSCHGDTYIRNGDGEIPEDAQPGSCGECGGTGKLECWTCHGNPTRACDGCGGTGKEECQVGTCKVSRAYDWKCPDCKGTGYILVGNPMPPKENNDGVRNVPANGDYIVTDSLTWAGYIYDGGSGSSEPSGGSQTPPDGGQESAAPPPEETASVRASGTDLEPGGREQRPASGTDLVPPSDAPIPDDRTHDFDLTPVPGDSGVPAASVRVETGRMSESEAEYYASLPDAELASILSAVQSIVSTAEPGRSDGEDELLEALAAQNGFDSLQSARILPIYFEGHQDVGFPVRVTVSVEQGALAGGAGLYVYHIAADGTIEPLGQAEYTTYEDGTVQSVSFFTTAFSSFFTAGKELDTGRSAYASDNGGETPVQTPQTTVTQTPAPTDPPPAAVENAPSVRPAVPVIIAAVILALAAAVVVFVRKRKTQE